jgi:hypothetical protein
MNKKYLLVILAIVFLLWWTNKAKAAPKPTPAPAPKPSNPLPSILQDKPSVFSSNTNYTVKSGDTWYKIVSKFWPEEAGPKTQEKLLLFAKQNAVANGFDWGKYDNVPSSDLKDPDTLKVGQKLLVWTWGSFNENTPSGMIMPGQQANAFNSWDQLI